MKGNGVNKLNGQKSASSTLDTLSRLRDAGFDQKQAEEIVRSQEVGESHLANKYDIALIQKEIKEIEANLKTDMKELELRITRFYLVTTLTVIGIILGGMVFLGKFGLLTPMKVIAK